MPSLMPQQVHYMPQAAPYQHGTAMAAAAAAAVAAAARYPAVAPPQPQFPAPQPEADDEATKRLARLETALLSLKPQIEALVMAQGKAQQASPQPPPQQTGQRISGFSADEGAGGGSRGGSDGKAMQPGSSPGGGGAELRTRRQMECLKIVTSPADKNKKTWQQPTQAQQPQSGVQLMPPPQAELSSENEPPQKVGQQNAGTKASQSGEKARPRVINTVRMAPSDMDPKSPRSPGRYTAWS